MTEKRVLVVDDEEPIRVLLQEALSESGYAVTTATNGGDAYDQFRDTPFDVVVTDLKMPGVSGETLFTRIKAEFPETVVIVLTGHATLKSAVEALHSGCDEFLLKPLPTVDLMHHAIERCLTRRDALARAGSFRRLSEAQTEILAITLEELTNRFAEMEECLDRTEEAQTSGDPETARGFLSDLRESLVRMGKTVGELEKVQAALGTEGVG